jgi:hypothetical protein
MFPRKTDPPHDLCRFLNLVDSDQRSKNTFIEPILWENQHCGGKKEAKKVNAGPPIGKTSVAFEQSELSGSKVGCAAI